MDVKLAQFNYDTLLVHGWRKEWRFGQILAECHAIGIDIHDIDRRAFREEYSGKVYVRVAVHASCEKLSNILWRCKNMDDFRMVRNDINRGVYKFKGRACMIENKERRHKNADEALAGMDRIIIGSIKTGSGKLGGMSRGKHHGKGGRA